MEGRIKVEDEVGLSLLGNQPNCFQEKLCEAFDTLNLQVSSLRAELEKERAAKAKAIAEVTFL